MRKIFEGRIFEDIFETIPDPLLVLDSNLKVILANRSFYECFKMKPEETLGKFIYELGNKQWDIPRLCELLETVISSRAAFDDFEVEQEFTPIGRRIMLLNARQIEAGSQKKRMILLDIEDVTESRKSEILLEESEERFRRLFETGNDGILLFEKHEGKIIHANPAIMAMLDYPKEELIGSKLYDIGFPNQLGTIQEILQTLEKDGIIHYKDVPVKKKIPEVVDTDIYMVDKTRLVQCNVRDITERKRAEKDLRESEQKYKFLIENTNDIIWTFDLATMSYSFISPSVERILGYRNDEVVGVTLDDVFSPETKKQILDGFKRVARGDDPSGRILMEAEHRAKNDRWVWMEINAVLQKDELGNPVAFIGITRDITERRAVEEEQEKLQAQLNQAQKMESVGRLAGGVAHDFNNMLSVILGYTELSLDKVDTADPVYANLQEILAAGMRSAGVTRQLLAFARQQTVSPAVLDLNESVEGMLKMLRRLIGEDIDLLWKPGKGLWPVKIDPSQLDQILANLCVNAMDAIAGVGRITIETGKTTFDETYCRDHAGFIPGEFALLAVSDDGCGMDENTMHNLFEPFFTTKGVGKGTGLGLATVYGIVKQNDGFINVYSEPGKGTTFRIYLPRQESAADRKRAPEVRKTASGRGETVLIVEDEKSILHLAQRMLEDLDYTVLATTSPGEAVRLAEEHAGMIHLLITDVVMPEMNGRDLAERLQALYPGLKVLYMSGYTASVIAHRGVLEASMAFIQKPFSKRDLAEKVRNVLD
ncbi:MAG: PAS domain S-box protein [Desulfobacterales bacterium]|nr:PAS domain S-box protein [Desulfobacterales bacterium]